MRLFNKHFWTIKITQIVDLKKNIIIAAFICAIMSPEEEEEKTSKINR